MFGGIPCQPWSLAGRGAGAADARDLWPHFIRLVRDIRPRLVLLENVPGLKAASHFDEGLGRVLADLAASGYAAEWDCIPASAAGARHERDRLWLVAYPEHQPHEAQ